MTAIVPAILCGGAGTRLWPLSRAAQPKQFHALVTSGSLLQDTVNRASHTPEAVAPVLIAGEGMRAIVEEKAPPKARIVLEPGGKNTAPAAALAALAALDVAADAVVLMLPSDHHVGDIPAFKRAVAAGAELARDDRIVTFGIEPTEPHEGYGYIVGGSPLGRGLSVDRFVEKPKRAAAEALLGGGRAYWNSGIYMFGARFYLEELGRLAPEMRQCAEAAWRGGATDGAITTLDAAAWSACPSDSIDYAVAEKTDRAAVVPVSMAWSDVGSWAALHEIAAGDGKANALIGDVIAVDSSGSYLRAESRLLAVVGVENLIVVETPDAILVMPRDRAQDVKKIVEELKQRGRTDLL